MVNTVNRDRLRGILSELQNMTGKRVSATRHLMSKRDCYNAIYELMKLELGINTKNENETLKRLNKTLNEVNCEVNQDREELRKEVEKLKKENQILEKHVDFFQRSDENSNKALRNSDKEIENLKSKILYLENKKSYYCNRFVTEMKENLKNKDKMKKHSLMFKVLYSIIVILGAINVWNLF